MPVSLHALGLLAALASVALAATVAARRTAWLAGGSGLVAAMFLLRGPASADPAAFGLTIAGVSALALFRRLPFPVAAAGCGVFAGIWGDYLVDRGVPLWVGFAFALAAPAVSVILARNSPRFVPAYMQEESQVLIAGLGMLVVVVPQLTRGWRSAAAMNFGPDPMTTPAMQTANWLWPVLMTSLLGGAAFALVRARLQGRASRRGDRI